MMIIRVTGKPGVTISGDTYSAFVPVEAFDDGWVVETNSLIVKGLVTESALLNNFKSRLKEAADTWQIQLTAKKALETKLAGLEGKTL